MCRGFPGQKESLGIRFGRVPCGGDCSGAAGSALTAELKSCASADARESFWGPDSVFVAMAAIAFGLFNCPFDRSGCQFGSNLVRAARVELTCQTAWSRPSRALGAWPGRPKASLASGVPSCPRAHLAGGWSQARSRFDRSRRRAGQGGSRRVRAHGLARLGQASFPSCASWRSMTAGRPSGPRCHRQGLR